MSSRGISNASVSNASLIRCDNLLPEYLFSQGTRASKCRFSFIPRCLILAWSAVCSFNNNRRRLKSPSLPIFYSPCRLLQNNGVLKSVSTTRQVSDNTALDTIPANRDFASTGELDPGRTISLNWPVIRLPQGGLWATGCISRFCLDSLKNLYKIFCPTVILVGT